MIEWDVCECGHPRTYLHGESGCSGEVLVEPPFTPTHLERCSCTETVLWCPSEEALKPFHIDRCTCLVFVLWYRDDEVLDA